MENDSWRNETHKIDLLANFEKAGKLAQQIQSIFKDQNLLTVAQCLGILAAYGVSCSDETFFDVVAENKNLSLELYRRAKADDKGKATES